MREPVRPLRRLSTISQRLCLSGEARCGLRPVWPQQRLWRPPLVLLQLAACLLRLAPTNNESPAQGQAGPPSRRPVRLLPWLQGAGPAMLPSASRLPCTWEGLRRFQQAPEARLAPPRRASRLQATQGSRRGGLLRAAADQGDSQHSPRAGPAALPRATRLWERTQAAPGRSQHAPKAGPQAGPEEVVSQCATQCRFPALLLVLAAAQVYAA